MISYSQSNQDLFAMLVCNSKGKFIDIGSSIPTWQSNSLMLVENGWSGICMDAQNYSKEWKKYKNVKFINSDASNFNWELYLLTNDSVKSIDYLSIDVDNASFDALVNVIHAGIRFRCATIEHDSYRFGDSMRNSQRAIMLSSGYRIIKGDVSHKGFEYEDWFIHEDENFDEIKERMKDWNI